MISMGCCWIVIPVVEGSNPFARPRFKGSSNRLYRLSPTYLAEYRLYSVYGIT